MFEAGAPLKASLATIEGRSSRYPVACFLLTNFTTTSE
jgi:hypothetical protein